MFRGIPRQTVENFCAFLKKKKIIFWGFDSKKIREALSKYSNFDCIIDGNSELWGMRFETLQIYPPEHLYALNPETHLVLITSETSSIYSATRSIQLIDDFDIFYFNVLSDKFFSYFADQLYANLDRIKEVEKILEDDLSKKVYREVIYRRMIGATGEFKSLKKADNPQYIFLPMFQKMNDKEVFLDCGGYVGDSVEKFVLSFGDKVRKIYSFECLEENILKLRQTEERLKEMGWKGELVIVPHAVSDKNEKVIFNNLEGCPEGGYLPETRLTMPYNDKLAPANTFEVEAKTIDDFVPQEERITLIKMDIEGAEYAALKGAKKIIQVHKPRLAISIYHNPCDYWRICKLIQEFYPGYRFAVRHHQNNHLDTVLYAWLEE